LNHRFERDLRILEDRHEVLGTFRCGCLLQKAVRLEAGGSQGAALRVL
jgi:hypothetical protein